MVVCGARAAPAVDSAGRAALVRRAGTAVPPGAVPPVAHRTVAHRDRRGGRLNDPLLSVIAAALKDASTIETTVPQLRQDQRRLEMIGDDDDKRHSPGS